jgi:hypothetical protein
MTDKLTTLVTGFFGVSAIEATPLLMASVPSPEEITRIGQVLVQIAIGIVTLYRLLKGQSSPVETKKDEENNTPA